MSKDEIYSHDVFVYLFVKSVVKSVNVLFQTKPEPILSADANKIVLSVKRALSMKSFDDAKNLDMSMEFNDTCKDMSMKFNGTCKLNSKCEVFLDNARSDIVKRSGFVVKIRFIRYRGVEYSVLENENIFLQAESFHFNEEAVEK